MKNTILITVTFILAAIGLKAQDKTFTVRSFDKIIVSPHIAVNLIEGKDEGVVIENAKVPIEHINIEVEGNTLRVYLDGAKIVTKSEQVSNDRWRGKKPIYNGTMATATITYKTLKNLSIRGEEVVRSKGLLSTKEFKMSLYGAAKVYFENMDVDKLTVSIYGSSYLEITAGKVSKQVFRAYGESEVNTVGMNANETKITAYGESNFRVNVSDRLKVTSYGESNINYIGTAQVDRGLIVGEARVRKIG